MSLVAEIRRRNVLPVTAGYLFGGWLLTEVLTTILPTLGAPDWAAKMVILGFAFGFVPAVILAWIYELTPDGIKKEVGIDRDGANRRVAIGKLDYVTIVGVVLAVVFISYIGASQSPESPDTAVVAASAESVAVLPFVNMSSDEDNEYFSDGLTETLLHMLAQVPGLQVAARTSSFAFKGKNMDIREIADALQVAHILEGSVQQSGSKIRITAQLIRASDGYHVWSESFDRDNEDIFGVQDEIALKVGSALSASLLGSGGESVVVGVDTGSADAYDIYLQALQQRATFSYGGLEAAEKLLKGALTIDPDFLDAKIELASNYLHQYETGLMNKDDAFAEVLAITNQVLAVRPQDVSARAIQTFVSASPELESLVAENPREYQARLLLSRILQETQNSDRALQLQLEALKLDPFNARIHFEVGSLYMHLDQLEEARASLQTSLDLEPLQPNAYLRLGEVALKLGDGVEYLQQSLKAMEVDSRDHEIPGMIAGFLYQLGLNEEADDFRNRVNAIAPTSAAAYRIGLLRAISTGDVDASVAAARKAIEDDIEDRQFAYGGAVQYLLRTAARNGTVAAESSYLEKYAPGILDIDATVVPVRYFTAQQVAFDAWYTTLTTDELLRRMVRIQEIAASYGVDLLQDPDALSDVFSQQVLMNPDWRILFSQAQFSEFVADPRIQAAMQSWETEEEAARNRVRGYLQDLSSAS